MLRGIRWTLSGVALAAAIGGGAVHAQYYGGAGFGRGGYGGAGGYGGFGGWATSAIGDAERGYGAEAVGVGQLHEENAIAGSVNADTVMRFNQYMYNSRIEARKRYNAYETKRLNLDKAHYEERQARIRDNPTTEDIDDGNALNVILDEMTEPRKLHGSALRLASSPISPKVIKDIPFRDETDAITISLDSLTEDNDWPLPLRSEAFKPQREAYQKAIDDALEQDKDDGSLTPETIARVRGAVADLYRKVSDTIPATKQPDHLQATNYLKELAGLSKMLEKPNVEKLIAELEKVESTSVGNLIGFMHAYNLRFAPATTPAQRAVYHDLYPVMVAARDKTTGQPGDGNKGPIADNSAPATQDDNPNAIFRGFKDTHLNSGATAKP